MNVPYEQGGGKAKGFHFRGIPLRFASIIRGYMNDEQCLRRHETDYVGNCLLESACWPAANGDCEAIGQLASVSKAETISCGE
jgi:hypothetical protein